METRPLGRSAIAIAPIMLGGNVFGWTVDKTQSFALLDAFLDAGFNAIDTADAYSRWVPGHAGGESETIIGAWMKSRRNRSRVVLATKLGTEMGPGRKGLSKTYMRQAVEDSLRRLQVETIDLYQAHYDDPETPIVETLEAFTGLVREGKVRAIGASNFTPERLRASLEASGKFGLARYEALQPRYNLIDRSFETELQPLCRAQDVSVIPYFGLAAGFLTGKYRTEADLSKSVRGARMKDHLNQRGLRILAALDAVAAEYRTTPAAISLAWLMTRPAIAAPIASVTSLDQLEPFLAAVRLRLAPDALQVLEQASRPD